MPTKPKTLTPRAYDALLRDVKTTFTAAEHAASGEKLTAYWKIGKRIHRERLAQNAGYHNSVLRDLATDTGIALRSLQYALVFHTAYEAPPTDTGLTWSHYVVLLRLGSARDRDRYEKLALRENLSARQLAAAIDARLADPTDAPRHLERPHEPSYLYRAEVAHIVDGDTLLLDIDLGFSTTRRERIRLARIDAPELPTPEGRRAKDFLTKLLVPARTVVVQTRRVDLHGRYVGHLFVRSLETTIDDCFAVGDYVNERIVAEGHARVVR